jgi:hypothetical protein
MSGGRFQLPTADRIETHVMNVKLPLPPTPEFAAQHAQNAVSAVRRVEGFELDYTPASLTRVDDVILQFHAGPCSLDNLGTLIYSLGCYVGEVMVRNAGARWAMPDDDDTPSDTFHMMFVTLPNGTNCDPIRQAFTLYETGAEKSVAHFYQVKVHRDNE